MAWEHCLITWQVDQEGHPTDSIKLTYRDQPSETTCQAVTDLKGTIAALEDQGWERVETVSTSPRWSGAERIGTSSGIRFRRPIQTGDQS